MKARLLAAVSVVLGVFFAVSAMAQTADEKAVAMAVERLRAAMIAPDAAVLDALVAPELSYGHSGGKVEDKPTFVNTLVSGASVFVTISLTDQTIKLVQDTAVVRDTFDATMNTAGKPSAVKLKVLQVWQRRSGQWTLLARQAVRVVP